MKVTYQTHYPPWRIAYGSKLAYIPHFHNELEFVYCRTGHSTVLVERQEYRLEADDLLLVFPCQIHSYREDENLLRYLLIFSPEMVPAFRETLLSYLPTDPVLHHASDIHELEPLFEMLRAIFRTQSPYRDEIAGAYLTAMVGLLLPRLALIPATGQDFGMMRTILLYCSTHYREPLTIGTLSAGLHIQQGYVSHLFSHRLKIRFNDYINSMRISDAQILLRSTTDTVTNISSQVGFDTIRTFNRVFLDRVGITPTEYRRMARSKAEGEKQI